MSITKTPASMIDPSGATNGQILTFNGSTSTWVASSLSAQGFTASLSSNGYQKLPSGVIMQWGTFTSDASITLGSPQVITLPIKFPTSIFHASSIPDGAATVSPEGNWLDWSTAGKTTLSSLGIYSSEVGICKFFAIGC
jgi:hypothetical protein